MNLGVYIHIPFCRQKCLYCDFPSVANAEHLYQDYVAALCREIAGKGGLFAKYTVDTVYFGGGTPSLLPAGSLAKVLACLRANCRLTDDAEITTEANPGTVDAGKLAMLREAGFNRISLGVQAFDDKVLAQAGRIHGAADAEAAVAAAREAGFGDISIDLMYGLPGQSLASFKAGLAQAVALPLTHISVYGLKVEEGTPFARLADAGRLALPDEEEEEAMYQLTVDFLPAHDFERYEISNYAKAGHACRHNLKYWRYQPYLGFGAAAHSFIGGERLANTPDVADYIRAASVGEMPLALREKPDTATAIAEFSFLALRTATGLSYRHFQEEFGEAFHSRYGHIAEELAGKGLITIEKDVIRLTKLGMKYGNVVFAAFLPE